MGLDAIELVLEVEETFDIKIDDDEAANIVTIGALADLIVRKRSGASNTDCQTANAFFRLRRTFLTVLAVDRKAFRPVTPTSFLLPVRGRKKIWKKLEQELSMRLPPLSDRTGAGVALGAGIAFIAGFIIVGIASRDILVACAASLFALLPGLLFGYILGLVCAPTPQRQHQTIGGLTRGVVAYNYDKFVRTPATFLDKEQVEKIWNQLCDLIAKQTGVPRERIQRDTSFVTDLGF